MNINQYQLNIVKNFKSKYMYVESYTGNINYISGFDNIDQYFDFIAIYYFLIEDKLKN